MRFIGIIVFFAVCCVCMAFPNPDVEVAEADHHEEGHTLVRVKRFTCDVLSATKLNDSACAAHCLVKGFRGGWCDSKRVCNCRR